MKAIRDYIDKRYIERRDRIFDETKDDPESAHENFVRAARRINYFRLNRLFLDCPENYLNPGFEISNAAGFNKNGDIPPLFLRYLGFDRVVVGTVTADSWSGHPRPRIKRYPDTSSLVNWMGLPGIGAKQVADNLYDYGNHGVPLTINFMSTPGKKGDEILSDLDATIRETKRIPSVVRYELNISCPNTHSSSGNIDARDEHQKQLDSILQFVSYVIEDDYELWLKLSPDLDRLGIISILDVAQSRVNGFVPGNTTTYHDPRYITSTPGEKGGASGNAVWEKSLKFQEMLCEELDKRGSRANIIACGGINSMKRVRERVNPYKERVKGIQIFTPLIFEGPGLLRKLRDAH